MVRLSEPRKVKGYPDKNAVSPPTSCAEGTRTSSLGSLSNHSFMELDCGSYAKGRKGHQSGTPNQKGFGLPHRWERSQNGSREAAGAHVTSTLESSWFMLEKPCEREQIPSKI